MIDAFLRLFALRPFFSMAIMGFPILLLVAVGLITIFALKALVFIVLPIAVVGVLVFVARKMYKAMKARQQFDDTTAV